MLSFILFLFGNLKSPLFHQGFKGLYKDTQEKVARQHKLELCEEPKGKTKTGTSVKPACPWSIHVAL